MQPSTTLTKEKVEFLKEKYDAELRKVGGEYFHKWKYGPFNEYLIAMGMKEILEEVVADLEELLK